MMTETIQIENLKCGGCANTIKRKLQEMDHVEQVEVHIDESEVLVSHEGGLDRDTLVATLGKLGYPEAGHGTTAQMLRSYVSCAVGRMTS